MRKNFRVLLLRSALVVAGLGTGLGIAEVAMIRADVLPDFYWEWHDAIVVLDRDVLYKFRGHSRADLNRRGYRDYEFDHDKGTRQRILMIGDSFQFGDNVEPDQTLAKVLERKMGDDFEVFNLGIPGYGPDQSYAQVVTEGLALEPDAVVLSLYPANDFNDIFKNRLYVPGAGGTLVYNSSNPVAAVLPWFRTTTLLRRVATGHGLDPDVRGRLEEILGGDRYDVLVEPGSASARYKVRLMRGVLRLLKKTLASHDVDFYVFLIPSEENIQSYVRFRRWKIPRDAYFNNEELAREICEQERLQFVDLRRPFLRHRKEILFTPKDGHLSVAGVELATRYLEKLLESS